MHSFEFDPQPYWTAADGSADIVGDWIECSPGSVLILQTSWTAVVGTAGDLALDGTQDPLQAADSVIELPELTTGVYGTWPSVGATAASAAVILRAPFRFMRQRFVWSAGGDAGQFSAWRELRSR